MEISSGERVILDTDLGADCDDAGAFAVMHALADRGEIEILAVGIVNSHPNAVPCAHAINTWFGRPEVPIGTIKRETGFSHDNYLPSVIREYPHGLTKESAPEVVQLYRQTLAKSPDKSVTLVSIGPPSNFSDLLDSPPDEISGLSGLELVRRKVKFYAAGGNGHGKLPRGMCGWNYQQDIKAARNELAKMPAELPMVYAGGSGWSLELGECYRRVRPDHIVRSIYVEHLKGKEKIDRPTWDELRVLYACRPAARKLWDTSARGRIHMDEKKLIHWQADPAYNRAYAYVNDLEAMRRELEPLMMHDPREQ